MRHPPEKKNKEARLYKQTTMHCSVTFKTSAVVRDNPALNIRTRQSSFCFLNDKDISADCSEVFWEMYQKMRTEEPAAGSPNVRPRYSEGLLFLYFLTL